MHREQPRFCLQLFERTKTKAKHFLLQPRIETLACHNSAISPVQTGASNVAKLTKSDLIRPHKEDVAGWAAQGKKLREMELLLRDRGVDADHNAVRRFCHEEGIVLASARPELPDDPAPPQSDGATEASFDGQPAATPEGALPQRTGPTFEIGNFAARVPVIRPKPPDPKPTPPGTDAPPKAAPDSNLPTSKESSASPAIATPSENKVAEPPQFGGGYPPPPVINRRAWQPPALPFARMSNPPVWTPDLELLRFGEDGDCWSLRDAFEGTFILGGTGSGKTSGSGKALAHTFLEHGFGGLVLTVKGDERERWEKYCRETGREHHLCIVERGGSYRFNFLDYEVKRPDTGAGLIENLAQLFYTSVSTSSRDNSGVKNASFWKNTGKQLLRNVFRVLERSRETISVDDMKVFISSAPATMKDARAGIWKETEFGKWLYWATENVRGTPNERVIADARRYWLEEYPMLAPETRASILFGITSLADSFVEPTIHELFCGETTITPQAALDGAIILVDLPVHLMQTVGVFCQAIWKHVFQKAVERRSDPDGPTRRPVFLWADEAQHFYSENDMLFQSTARSSRCATVYITQNIPSFYAIADGFDGRNAVDAFLGNLTTKIIHNNNDPTSNRWAADQIGRFRTLKRTMNSGSSSSREGSIFDFMKKREDTSSSLGLQDDVEYEVQPSDFMGLRTGGEQFDYEVDAYFIKPGVRFLSTGKHYLRTVFQQEF